MNQTIDQFLHTLKHEVGVRESNDNSGERVREYQAATTLGGSHWPWCAALLAFAFKETEKARHIDIPWTFSASCDVIWADAKARGLVRNSPQVGDVFIVKAAKGGGYSPSDGIHTGAVTEVIGNHFRSIEGNTNNGGGREGVAVMEHTREVSSRYVFIRWIDGVPSMDDHPAVPWKVSVIVKGKPIVLKAVLNNGTNYIAARDLGNALGTSTVWDADNGEVNLRGKPVGAQPRMMDGTAYFPVRVLADHLGLTPQVNTQAQTVVLL